MKLNKKLCMKCHERYDSTWDWTDSGKWHTAHYTWKDGWEGNMISCIQSSSDDKSVRVARVNDYPPKWCPFATEHIALWAAKQATRKG